MSTEPTHKEQQTEDTARRGAWIRMNGSVGCMPDSINVHETKHDAIVTAQDLFNDLPEPAFLSMTTDLAEYGIHYFDAEDAAGADYVSVEYDATADPAEYEEN